LASCDRSTVELAGRLVSVLCVVLLPSTATPQVAGAPPVDQIAQDLKRLTLEALTDLDALQRSVEAGGRRRLIKPLDPFGVIEVLQGCARRNARLT
jgi:hypothetical protein